MVTKHYPPQIKGTIPAFYIGETLTVPFKMNQTVGWNEIDGFSIKIKSVQNNDLIATLTTLSVEDGVLISKHDSNCAYFDTASIVEKIQKGISYKIQMCYINGKIKENSVNITNYGYYSTVGVVKCTTRPVIKINELNEKVEEGKATEVQNDNRSYTGYYSQKVSNENIGDISEKVYSYNFSVYDDQDNLFETSGELLHNHNDNDNIYETMDKYTLIKSLEENKVYNIVYTVTTANGAVASTIKYPIQAQGSVPPAIDATLMAEMNEENGYVFLQLIGDKDSKGNEKPGTGNFVICRASSKENYSNWYEMDRFVLMGEKPSTYHWKDFTVEHGYNYIYSLQQYKVNSNIYSTRLTSNEVEAKFEHCFLYDGKRQLKIKYNPKIGAIKETLLESKTNTMGGKYPFFFRNGNVAYKEFSISGLISYHSDEEELFLSNEEMFLEDLEHFQRKNSLKPGITSNSQSYFDSLPDIATAYTIQGLYADREYPNSQENQIANGRLRNSNLTDYNILAERIFKTTVLNFLNDEQPKLFRSPAEGNCIVRLMNSSLAPDDKLNRMIHTLSTTATEIDNCGHLELSKYGLLSTNEPDIKMLQTETLVLSERAEEVIELNNQYEIKYIKCQGMIGTSDAIVITYKNGSSNRIYLSPTEGYIELSFDESPSKIIIETENGAGSVTYQYYTNQLNTVFDSYKSITNIDIPIRQIRGNNSMINNDIRSILEDKNHKVLGYYFLQFTRDPDPSDDFPNNKFWIDNKEYSIGQETLQIDGLKHIPKVRISGGVLLNASIRCCQIQYE